MKDWAPGAGPDRVLVIVPAYNEEAVIGATLAGLREELPGADVLVVDDGSVDATADVARAAGFPVARLACNLGVGAALRTGFVYASRNGYGRAVQFDADGQHNAAEVKVLLEALDADIDLVIGSRFATSETVFEVGRIRSGAMRALRVLVALVSRQHLSDTSSGFRGFSGPLLEFFAANYPAEYLGDTVEAIVLAARGGFKVAEVPVRMHERTGGRASTRGVRLVYHYIRLVTVLVVTATPRRERARR